MSNIDVARRLIDDGIPPFPCSAVDKTPLTAHGFKDRTTDRPQIEEWGRRFPTCLWGVVPGDRGAIVADVDKPITQTIAAQLGLTSVATYRTATPGGLHVWFRNVAGLTGQPLVSLADVGLPMTAAERLVIRIDRGYVIESGCVRADGGVYQAVGTPADIAPRRMPWRICLNISVTRIASARVDRQVHLATTLPIRPPSSPRSTGRMTCARCSPSTGISDTGNAGSRQIRQRAGPAW